MGNASAASVNNNLWGCGEAGSQHNGIVQSGVRFPSPPPNIMKLKEISESANLPRLGSPIKAEVVRSGSLHPYGTFMNFGSEVAATHAARGQERNLNRGILNINKIAILKDSRAAHDKKPDRFAEDLVMGGTLPEPIINYVKKVEAEQGVKEAFDIIRRALEHRGYDGIAYVNVNEDPGSISYVVWDPSKFKPVN